METTARPGPELLPQASELFTTASNLRDSAFLVRPGLQQGAFDPLSKGSRRHGTAPTTTPTVRTGQPGSDDGMCSGPDSPASGTRVRAFNAQSERSSDLHSTAQSLGHFAVTARRHVHKTESCWAGSRWKWISRLLHALAASCLNVPVMDDTEESPAQLARFHEHWLSRKLPLTRFYLNSAAVASLCGMPLWAGLTYGLDYFYPYPNNLPAFLAAFLVSAGFALLLHARRGWTSTSLSLLGTAFTVCVATLGCTFNIPTGDPDAMPFIILLGLGMSFWFSSHTVLRKHVSYLALVPVIYIAANAIWPVTRAQLWPVYALHAFLLLQFMIMASREVGHAEAAWKHHVVTRDALEEESAAQGELLRLLLPPAVLAAVQGAGGAADAAGRFAESYSEVSVLFIEILGLDDLAVRMPPISLLSLLNDVFSELDALVKAAPSALKIETVSGVYMVCCGLPDSSEPGAEGSPEHALHAAILALACRDCVHGFTALGEPLRAQLGLHVGPCVGGVIGEKLPRFRLFGDTVNTAARYQTSAPVGVVQLSARAAQKLLASGGAAAGLTVTQRQGNLVLKGKGHMRAYFLQRISEDGATRAPSAEPSLQPAVHNNSVTSVLPAALMAAMAAVSSGVGATHSGGRFGKPPSRPNPKELSRTISSLLLRRLPSLYPRDRSDGMEPAPGPRPPRAWHRAGAPVAPALDECGVYVTDAGDRVYGTQLPRFGRLSSLPRTSDEPSPDAASTAALRRRGSEPMSPTADAAAAGALFAVDMAASVSDASPLVPPSPHHHSYTRSGHHNAGSGSSHHNSGRRSGATSPGHRQLEIIPSEASFHVQQLSPPPAVRSRDRHLLSAATEEVEAPDVPVIASHNSSTTGYAIESPPMGGRASILPSPSVHGSDTAPAAPPGATMSRNTTDSTMGAISTYAFSRQGSSYSHASFTYSRASSGATGYGLLTRENTVQQHVDAPVGTFVGTQYNLAGYSRRSSALTVVAGDVDPGLESMDAAASVVQQAESVIETGRGSGSQAMGGAANASRQSDHVAAIPGGSSGLGSSADKGQGQHKQRKNSAGGTSSTLKPRRQRLNARGSTRIALQRLTTTQHGGPFGAMSGGDFAGFLPAIDLRGLRPSDAAALDAAAKVLLRFPLRMSVATAAGGELGYARRQFAGRVHGAALSAIFTILTGPIVVAWSNQGLLFQTAFNLPFLIAAIVMVMIAAAIVGCAWVLLIRASAGASVAPVFPVSPPDGASVRLSASLQLGPEADKHPGHASGGFAGTPLGQASLQYSINTGGGDSVGALKSEPPANAAGPVDVSPAYERFFIEAVFVSQLLVAFLFSQASRIAGTTLATSTWLYLYTVWYSVAMLSLQAPWRGLSACAAIHVHHLACVAADAIAAPQLLPEHARLVRPYYLFMLIASFLLHWASLYFSLAVLEANRRSDFLLEASALVQRDSALDMVNNMIPQTVNDAIQRNLRAGEPPWVAFSFDAGAVLFADIVQFTTLGSRISAEQLCTLLHDLFSQFDLLCAQCGVEKIETIGDAYLAAAGCTPGEENVPPAVSAARVASLAIGMQKCLENFTEASTGTPIQMRIGLNLGPVVAGVLGTDMLRFHIFGSTVDAAVQLEAAAPTGGILCSASFASALSDEARDAIGLVPGGQVELVAPPSVSAVGLPQSSLSAPDGFLGGTFERQGVGEEPQAPHASLLERASGMPLGVLTSAEVSAAVAEADAITSQELETAAQAFLFSGFIHLGDSKDKMDAE